MNPNLNINSVSIPLKNPDALHDSTVEEVNIYNQAFLQLDRPLIKSSVVHERTKYELPVVFNIDGEINGNIICLLDTYNKNIEQSDQSLFNSLYLESMNILLGKMMTNLEKNSDITALITNPKIPKDNILTQLMAKNYNADTLSMGYKLISNGSEYDCRIIFNINKKTFSEV